MIGTIIGDMIGSRFEFNNHKSTDFELFVKQTRFTDDTVLSIATADVLMNGGSYAEKYRAYARFYPAAGFGKGFALWVENDQGKPYNSWGNGSAMRVSPVGFFCETLEDTLAEAKKSAEVTHNHPEGIKGAQAVAAIVFMARTGSTKEEIKAYIESTFSYDLSRTLDEIRPDYSFHVSCMKSVPEAIIAFLESNDFEDAIRKAVSIGGDSDTIAAITGGMAQAFYGDIDPVIIEECVNRLDPPLLIVLGKFLEQQIDQMPEEEDEDELPGHDDYIHDLETAAMQTQAILENEEVNG